MRIRGGHIAGAAVIGIAAFVLYATLSLPPSPDEEPAETASLPPIDADPSLVPVIALAAPELNCGTIPNTGITERTMAVYNRGKAPLFINDIRTSCACTTGRVPESARSIPPGGEGVIEIAIDPWRIPGFYSRKSLTVFSNDPRNGRVTFDVVANIEPEFETTPEKANFGKVTKGQPHTQSVRIRQRQEKRIEFTSVEAQGALPGAQWADIQATLTPVPEKEWRLPGKAECLVQVTIPPDIPVGSLRRIVEIATSVERVPRFRLQVEADVEAPYTVNPPYPQVLAPKAPQPGRPSTATLTVAGKEPIQIEDTGVDSPTLAVTQRPGEAPNSILLDVTIVPDAPPGRIESMLRFTVRTSQDEYHEWTCVRAFKLPERDQASSS